MVNGACGEPSKDPVSITSIASGGQGEVTQALLVLRAGRGACASPRTGPATGQAFLANCYE